MNEVIAIFGPTGSGKTRLAYTLAAQSPATTLLVSVDSRKVYRKLTIGTHKDELYEIAKRLPQLHMFGHDLIDPDQTMNASVFQGKVYAWLAPLLQSGQYSRVIFFGGTGLFLDSVLFMLPHGHSAAQPQLRQELEALNLVDLQQRVQKEQPSRWRALNESDRANPRRLIRSLEKPLPDKTVVATTDEQLIRQWWESASWQLYLPQLTMAELEEKLAKRVRLMLRHGWCEEVASVLAHYPLTAPGLQIMGYREMVALLQQYPELAVPHQVRSHLAKEALQQTTQGIILRHRQYAKRQLTWAKRYERVTERKLYQEAQYWPRLLGPSKYTTNGTIGL